MKALDVAANIRGKCKEIKALGFDAVGFYLRPDRMSKATVAEAHTAGLKLFAIWEKGYPVSPAYFTPTRGANDGRKAAEFAKLIGQPLGSQIFAAVDYDADVKRHGDRILGYFKEFQAAVKHAGYLASVYGSGAVCRWLVGSGYAHTGFLAMSKGWAGYSDYVAYAAIVQHRVDRVAGFDVDTDTVQDVSVVW